MMDQVLNVAWHAQQASELDPANWAQTSRNPLIDPDPRKVYFMPEIRLADHARKAKLTWDTETTAIFSPTRQRDAKPSAISTTLLRIQQGTAWPNQERRTQFGMVKFGSVDIFTEHGNKKGAETDLGSSKATPSLALAHGHHNNMSTAGMYQVSSLLLPAPCLTHPYPPSAPRLITPTPSPELTPGLGARGDGRGTQPALPAAPGSSWLEGDTCGRLAPTSVCGGEV